MKLTYIVDNENIYTTVKDVLKNYFEISARLLLRLKTNQKIFLNSNITYVNTSIKDGDLIEVFVDFIEDNSNIFPTKMDLDIIYEDDYYLVVNKPSGMAIHPSNLHYDTSLSNGIKYYFDSIHLSKKVRPVSRLDKDTSGLVVFAKNEYIQERLVGQMKNGTLIKEYIAILDGIIEKKSGTISAPIARKENSIIERCINNNGDISITHYEVLEYIDRLNLSIVKYRLETGRTHQLRVHSVHIGYPIIGDTLYGTASTLINRQALHSNMISFTHPVTKEHVTYTAQLPEDMKNIIEI